MRTYLIDQEKNEYVVDLVKVIKHSSELFEFHYSTVRENRITDQRMVFVRKLAGNYFASFDKRRWKKLARQELPKKIVNVDKVYDVYRGYRPSGAKSLRPGALRAQMPGKVVKILVKEGQKVQTGETLLVLEAMKMENEIRAGLGGIVEKIHVTEGEILESGVLMVEMGEKS